MAALSASVSSVCRVALSRLESRDATVHQEILEALKTKNFFFVKLNSEQCATVKRCLEASKEFFSSTDLKAKNSFRVSSKLGYKKNTPKERFQFRLSGTKLTLPATTPPHFIESIENVYKLFDHIATLCLQSATSSFDVPLDQVLAAYGDPSPLPASGWATSVFNVFHYFNTPESLKAQNCVEHIDPGFITVLAKAPVNGLEAIDGTTGQYVLVEPLMEDDEVCVLPGETLERLLGRKIKGNLHRVVPGEGSRLNLTFELRPLLPIYHEWGSAEEQKARKDANASKSSGNVSLSEFKDVY